MFRLHNKIEKSERQKISSKRLQFLLALGRFVTYTFLSARGVAQLGSATALGAVGRWFESSHPDHFFFLLYPCGGSSIGRASAFQADCCGFESRPPLHKISCFKSPPCSRHYSEYLPHLLFLHGCWWFFRRVSDFFYSYLCFYRNFISNFLLYLS